MAAIVKELTQYQDAEKIFSFIKDETYAVFLDSSMENKLGQYSIIGFDPYLILKEEEGIFYHNGKKQKGSLENYLKKYLKEHYEDNETNLPLTAGAIGYFSYDYGRKFENISTRHKKEINMPEALVVFYDLFLIEDKKKKKLYLSALGKTQDPQKKICTMERIINNLKVEEKKQMEHKMPAAYTSDFSKEDYQAAIEAMKHYMREGDIYVANMTRRMKVESKKDPYEVFQYIRKFNPSPFGGFLQYGDFQIVSASMERFLQIKNGWAVTRPIKGTRKRGRTKEEDEFLEQELQESTKDRSELLMIVDLERNDFHRICEPGTVEVTKHFEVETYATVFHLISEIRGKLKEGYGAVDLLSCAFPGGSITGAPKIHAMEIIDELERSQRGLYTGSIGYFSLNGDCDLNIVIRTLVVQNGIYHLGVGGGITYESDTAFEYEETIQKAKALLLALGNGEEE